MSWHELDLVIPCLEKDIVNNVFENVHYLKSALETAGYTVGSITAPQARYDTYINQILTKLQTVEDDVGVINEVIESINYDGAAQLDETFVLEDYQRWVLILNDLYDIIINGAGQWGQMYLTLEEGTPDVQDINRDDVYIRGDSIG